MIAGSRGLVFASGEKLYQVYNIYHSMNSVNATLIRVIDGRDAYGNDNLAFCYDQEYSFLTSQDSEFKTYYTRIENYLDLNDIYTEKYEKERIAVTLVARYSVNSYGIFEQFNLTFEEDYYMAYY